VVHVEDPEISVKETLEPLDRQNKGLASSEWIVVRSSERRDATSAHFAALIGDRPLEELKALNFKPYCGLGRATIKLPVKARKGSEDEKGGAEPTI
jgi:hypothetical protein